ncbi:right-handed parallel beta-helix repeat-containing protein [Nocardiopsis ganjiahuensis]|uniref:right-handed parallel beta-helix repeat-containing protein n=1 Tax=Nocardiopsis ganjiahuensis TaxID=239984 RepID=UPI00034B27FA|nr:right-handed parallel beta-helix repeat-containing protein [Nocardiopsis ganjiahuensis]
MYTARVSKTDPHAFPSLRAVLRDARYANTDLYLHVEPGHYTEPYALEISTRVMVVPVGGPGTVEISASAADSVFVVKGDRAALELYGVHVRGRQDAPGCPTILAEEGTRFKAVDSVFTSGAEIEVKGDGTEVVNCRFDGCGLFWKRGTGGFVRDAVFRGASLLFWRAVNPTVSSVRFSDYDRSAVIAAESSVTVTDCVMTATGPPDGASVFVKEGADVRFTDLSISDSPGAAVYATGEGTRIALDRLNLTGWKHTKVGVGVGPGAEICLTSSRIDAEGAASAVMSVKKGSATVRDVIVENTGKEGFLVMDGRLTGRGLVFRRLAKPGITAARSRIELSDVEFAGGLPDSETPASGFYLSDCRLEADGVRASDLNGTVLMTTTGGRATLTSVSTERVKYVVMAGEDSTVAVRGAQVGENWGTAFLAGENSTVTVHDARITENRGSAFSARKGGSLTAVDALVSGSEREACWADGGSLTLTSVTVSGATGPGAVAGQGGELTLEDTVIRDGNEAGVRVLDAESRAALLRSRITGNALAGVRAHPEAAVERQDTVLLDNGGEDRESVREERAEK